MTEQDIARVAAGLTRAQREALYTLSYRPARPKASGAALMALVRKGLAKNGWSQFNGNLWSIKPDGLAVRDHILREKIDG